MTFLRNAWYLAGWSDEVSADTMLTRTILGESIVLFRDAEGQPAALLDRCPHRFAPLSRGSVEGGQVICGYHGLGFGGDGRCTRNPHGPITSATAARAYPVCEQHRAIWVWPGDPEQADEHAPPDLGFVDATPPTAWSSGYLLGRGNYQLFVDNILDLTHTDYLHADTLGGGAMTRTRGRVTETPDSVVVEWNAVNETPMPLAVKFGGVAGNVDSWTRVEWFAPSILTLGSCSVPTGTPRESGGSTLNLHIMTPETETTTHYFFASTRDFRVDDVEFNATFAAGRAQIFLTEDEPMIEAQQQAMGSEDLWSLNPVMLRIDEGAVRVRRRLAKMIDAEQSVS